MRTFLPFVTASPTGTTGPKPTLAFTAASDRFEPVLPDAAVCTNFGSVLADTGVCWCATLYAKRLEAGRFVWPTATSWIPASFQVEPVLRGHWSRTRCLPADRLVAS